MSEPQGGAPGVPEGSKTPGDELVEGTVEPAVADEEEAPGTGGDVDEPMMPEEGGGNAESKGGSHDEHELEAPLEAILFSSEVPLTGKKLASLLGVRQREVLAGIDRLNVFYGETGRAFRISPLAGGFQLITTSEHAAILGKLHKERVPTRLSRAALETLSIIAFKQPVTRGEIDAIRGVSASDRVLRHLIERKLVRIAGRAETPGRPLLYGTTREFLGYFGLSAVSDLPRTDELEALLAGDVPGEVMDGEETRSDRGSETSDGSQEHGEGRGDDTELGMIDAAPPAGEEADDLRDEEGRVQAADQTADEPAERFDDELVDDLAEEFAEEAAKDEESHSGEESDEHEGIRSPQ